MADPKDVRLRLAIETSGAEGVQKLASEIEALAKEGGAAAPAFQKLADELNQIGRQASAVDTFAKLQAEVAQTAAGVAVASQNIERLGAALQEQTQQAAAFKDAQVSTKAAVDATATQIRDLETRLRTLRSTSDDAAKKTDDYKTSVLGLRNEIGTLKTTLDQQKAANREATAAVQESEAALKATTKAYNAMVNEAKGLANETARGNATLDKARATLAEVGVETAEVAAAQAALSEAMATSRAEVERQVTAYEASQASAKKLAEAEKLLHAEMQIEQDIARKSVQASEAEAAATKRATEQILASIRERAAAIRQSAVDAETALNNAFAKTGARSAQAITQEIADIRSALLHLQTSTQVTGAEFDRAFGSAQQRIKTLEAELEKIPGHMSLAQQTAGFLNAQFVQLAATYGAIELGKKFIDANIQIEALRRSLTLITGSTKGAADQIKFLQDTANRTGQDVSALSQAFISFAASASASNISLASMQGIFSAVTNASGQLGLSTEKTTLILQALAQMANKGVVSMEELRGQLGESLPGAMAVTAKGLGITESQLVKLVESGKLLTEDFFPAFQKGLAGTFGDGRQKVDGFLASWNRLKNGVTEAFQVIGDTGALDALKGAMFALAGALGVLLQGFSAIFDTIFTTIRQISIAVAALVNRDFKNLGAESKKLWEDMIDRQTRLAEVLQRAVGASDDAGTAQAKLGTSVQQAGQQAQTAAGGHQANATAQQGTATAAGSNADAQGKAGTAAAQAGQSAAQGAQGWVAIQVAYQKMTEDAEKAVVVSTKLAEAKKIEGEVLKSLAVLEGNEIEIQQVALKAALDYEEAVRKVADARTREAQILAQQIEALTAQAAAEGKMSENRQKQIKELNDLLTKKQAEAESSRQAAQAAAQETAQRQVAAETYKDNSARLGELKKAAEAAREALATLRVEHVRGLATQEQVNDAARKAAAAEALYKDALDDTAKAAERKIDAIKRDSAVAENALRIDLARAKTSEQQALLYGNERLAIEAKVRQKEIEIKIVEANIKAAIAEANAILAATEAERANLEATGKLTEQKKAEIEARVAAAKAKIQETELSKEIIRQTQIEIESIRNRGLQSKTTADQVVSSRDREVAATEKAIEAAERLAEAERKRQNVDKDGFSLDSNGSRINIPLMGDVPDGMVFDKAAFDRATLQSALSGLAAPDPKKFVHPAGGSSVPVDQFGPYAPTRAGVSPFGHPAGSLPGFGGASAPTPAPAPAPTAPNSTAAGTATPQGVTHTVRLDFGGKSYDVGTTAGGADELLRALEEAKRRAGL